MKLKNLVLHTLRLTGVAAFPVPNPRSGIVDQDSSSQPTSISFATLPSPLRVNAQLEEEYKSRSPHAEAKRAPLQDEKLGSREKLGSSLNKESDPLLSNLLKNNPLPEGQRASIFDKQSLEKIEWSQTEVFRTLAEDLLPSSVSPSSAATFSPTSAQAASTFTPQRIRRSPGSVFDPALLITQLTQHPVEFLAEQTVVIPAQFGAQALPHQGYVRISERANGVYQFDYTDQSIPGETLPAYFLEDTRFRDLGAPPYLDLPSNPAEGTLVMIGELDESSVVVIQKHGAASPADTGVSVASGFRLVRDVRLNSAVLYDDVRMAVDFKDYRTPGSSESRATALMVYKNTQWQLCIQRQQLDTDGRSLTLRLDAQGQPLPLLHYFPSTTDLSQTRRAEFFQESGRLLEQMRKINQRLGLPTQLNAREQADVRAEETTVLGVLTFHLRNYLTHQQALIFNQKKQIQQQLEAASFADKERYRAQLSGLDQTLQKLIEVYATLWHEANYMDITLGKLRAKENHGAKVVEFLATMEPSRTVSHKRYRALERYLLNSYNPLLKAAIENYKQIALPDGFIEQMAVKEMKSFFVQHYNDLSMQQKGAAIRYIGEAVAREASVVATQKADNLLSDLRRARRVTVAYAKAMPASVFLNSVGDVYRGRCAPLTLVMAVALANGETAVDHFVDKLNEVVLQPQHDNAKLLIDSLVALHIDKTSGLNQAEAFVFTGDDDEVDTPSQGIDDLGRRLNAAAETIFFALVTENHQMLAGVGVEGEHKRYYFYDPNFFVVGFDTRDSFEEALIEHFVRQGLAGSYQMGELHDPKFSLTEIHPLAMGEVMLGHGLKVRDLVAPRDLNEARDISFAEMFRYGTHALLDTRLETSFAVLDSRQQAQKLKQATEAIVQEHRQTLGAGKWTPVLSHIEETKPAGLEAQVVGIETGVEAARIRYRIPFLNTEMTQRASLASGSEREGVEEGATETSFSIQWIETNDARLADCKRFVETQTAAINKAYVWEQGQMMPKRSSIAGENSAKRATDLEGEGIHGLNAMAALQTLFREVDGPALTSSEGADIAGVAGAGRAASNTDLSKALQVHAYWSWIQIADGARQDINAVARLVKGGIAGGRGVLAISGDGGASTAFSLSQMQSFNHALSSGVGLILQGGNIVFDAYELAHTQSIGQRAVFATQLAFDTTNFIMSAASLTSGMMGSSAASASAMVIGEGVVGGAVAVEGAGGAIGGVIGGSLAEVVGPLAVPVAGLGIGFTALAKTYGQISEDAHAVADYFATLSEAYTHGGYQYDATAKVWIPRAGAVIKALDLAQGTVEFDSQYIYRTHHGSTGSGKANYFFWAGDFPKKINDRDQAINVRRSGVNQESDISHVQMPTGEIGWGRVVVGDAANSDIAKVDTNDSHESGNVVSTVTGNAIILPATPKSYISYKYESLPGATTLSGKGFSVLRNMEEDYRFDFDFYIFPSEYTIRKLYQEYVITPIDIVLDAQTRRLQMPELPVGLEHYLHYDLHGAGNATYIVGLNKGASLALITTSEGTRWVLDASVVADAAVVVQSNRLTIGEISIKLKGEKTPQIDILTRQGEMQRVDFEQPRTEVISEDASQWQSTEALRQRLEQIAKNHPLGTAHYIAVNNYVVGAKNVGRAYYDVSQGQMLYVDTLSNPALEAQLSGGQKARRMLNTQVMELAAVIENEAYFYDFQHGAVVRSDTRTGKILAHYTQTEEFSSGKLKRIWQEGDTVHFAWHHTLRWHQGRQDHIELSYALAKERSLLTSVSGNSKLLTYLDRFENGSPPALENQQFYTINGLMFLREIASDKVGAQLAPMLLISGENKDGERRRYWFRNHDSVLIKPNLAGVEPESGALDRDSNQALLTPITAPADLILAGSYAGTAAHAQDEIFYFYSPKGKTVYRQVGPGKTAWTLSEAAQKITIPNLASLLNMEGELLAVTKNGLIQKIEASGQLTLQGVNEYWLKDHPQWQTDLTQLAQEHRSEWLSILGLQDEEGHNLSAWLNYDRFVVMKGEFRGQTLRLLGRAEMSSEPLGELSRAQSADQPNDSVSTVSRQGMKTNSYTLFFVQEKHCLVRQAMVTAEAMIKAFKSDGDGGDTLRLKPNNSLSSPEKMLGDRPIKNVEKIDNSDLRITTQDGIYLNLDPNQAGLSATVLGVSAEWQKQHPQLKPALEQLGQTYLHGTAIVLEQARLSALPENPAGTVVSTALPPKWYHFQTQQIIHAYGLTEQDRPRLLSVQRGGDSTLAFVHSSRDGRLLKIAQTGRDGSASTAAPARPTPTAKMVSTAGTVTLLRAATTPLAAEVSEISPTTLIGHFSQIEIVNGTLLLQGQEHKGRASLELTVLPVIQEAKAMIVSGGRDGQNYTIDQAAWDHYTGGIVIDNYDDAREPSIDSLQLDIAHADNLIVSEIGEHVVVYEAASKKSLVLRNALSSNANGHLHLSLGEEGRKWRIEGDPPRLEMQ